MKVMTTDDRRSIWNAIREDNAPLLFSCLDSEDKIQLATTGLWNPNKKLGIRDRPLVDVLAINGKGVPSTGAVRCLHNLLSDYGHLITSEHRHALARRARRKGRHEAAELLCATDPVDFNQKLVQKLDQDREHDHKADQEPDHSNDENSPIESEPESRHLDGDTDADASSSYSDVLSASEHSLSTIAAASTFSCDSSTSHWDWTTNTSARYNVTSKQDPHEQDQGGERLCAAIAVTSLHSPLHFEPSPLSSPEGPAYISEPHGSAEGLLSTCTSTTSCRTINTGDDDGAGGRPRAN